MKTNFDQLIKNNVQNTNNSITINDSLTEKIISKILVQQRIRASAPIINQKVWGILLVISIVIIYFSFNVSKHESSNLYGQANEFIYYLQYVISKFVELSENFAFVYAAVAIFLIFDLILKKIFRNKKILHF